MTMCHGSRRCAPALPEDRRHRITPERKREIIEYIRRHAGAKLSWADVVRMSSEVVDGGFSRQALFADPEICLAYQSKKAALRVKTLSTNPRCHDRFEVLKRQNERLLAHNDLLVEQINRMQTNAALAGVDLTLLDAPLPPMHIENTDEPKEKSKAQKRKRDIGERSRPKPGTNPRCEGLYTDEAPAVMLAAGQGGLRQGARREQLLADAGSMRTAESGATRRGLISLSRSA